ncbi:MAG: AAA domain-containing protein [Desulfobacteraceae bacterium]|nr:AAA domain-containing protein [Desulfobacteraceae bacterium]
MKKGKLIDSKDLQEQIRLSFKRSAAYGIDPVHRDPVQGCLSQKNLARRRKKNQPLLDILIPQFKEFQSLLAPKEYFISAVDRDGYILHVESSPSMGNIASRTNCTPGFRWMENDVGTSAISLALTLQIPIQLSGAEHYCRQVHDLTSSSAPIFGKNKELIGVIAVAGSSAETHPHTLFMVTTAARAAEQQLRVIRRNRELSLNLHFLDQAMTTARNGLIVIKKDKYIWRVNRKARAILGMEGLEGKPLSILNNLDIDLKNVTSNPGAWINREYRLILGKEELSLIGSVQLVSSENGEPLGAMITFDRMDEVYQMADTIAGTRALFTFDNLTGTSPHFTKAVTLAKRAASSDTTVLLLGETGTGKELFAQAIHNQSRRTGQPFIPINCGAIPANLLESELFGYMDGTFTGGAKGGKPGKFELAGKGTVLLDEIGDMPHNMQVKLLRVLQTREVYRIGANKPVRIQTRIIAATHVDLIQAIQDGRFREDLYYRLNVFPIPIPPLKERGQEDILTLIRLFLAEHSSNPPRLSPEAILALCSYRWPGNVRELENCIQRALQLCENNVLDTAHLNLPLSKPTESGAAPGTLEQMNKNMIFATLEQTKQNMAETAKILGISRATLYRKLNRYKNGLKN